MKKSAPTLQQAQEPETPQHPHIQDHQDVPGIDTIPLIDETDLDSEETAVDDAGADPDEPTAKTHMTQEELDDPDIEEVQRERHLERDMTQEERLEVGLRMASCLEEAAELEVTKKEYDDRMKKSIEAHYSEATTLAHALKRGRREGNVPIRILKNWHTGSIIVSRLDDGEILEERAMTFDERQRAMFAGKIQGVVQDSAPDPAPSSPEEKPEVGLFEEPVGPADMLAQTAGEAVGNA